VARDFCLSCGRPLSSPCPCGVPREQLAALERQEQADLAAYARAELLQMNDLERWVESEAGPARVRDLLAGVHHEGAVWESGFRIAPGEVVQLVYLRRWGSRLMRWPLH
jgi:hypothetical protein